MASPYRVCPECGSEWTATLASDFCPDCGEPLGRVPQRGRKGAKQTWTCPECGIVLDDESDECPNCKNPLAWKPAVLGTEGTNGLAIASLVLGIFWLGGPGSILVIIFGAVARGQIARTEGRLGNGNRWGLAWRPWPDWHGHFDRGPSGRHP